VSAADYVDLSGEVDFAADDLYEPEERAGASVVREARWRVFWVVVEVLMLPMLVSVVHPRLEGSVGPVVARTLTAMLVAGVIAHAVVRLLSVPRVAQLVAGGSIVVLLGAMLAAGTPFTEPLLGDDEAERRSEERVADHHAVVTLEKQHFALRRRLVALGEHATAAKLDEVTAARRRAVSLHAPGGTGAAARGDAREWARELRDCRLDAATSVAIDAAGLTCR
jgi:hypothetical protein